MPKHGERTAPEGVDKEHKCWLYANTPWKRLCIYCCYYCERNGECENACMNVPELCGKDGSKVKSDV